MATLSGNKIKDTYQSLIKLTDNGNLTTGAKQLTDGFGNNSPLYISTTQIGIGVTPEATYDLHVYSNAKVGGNLTVTGDLTVEGTTTTIDTQTLTVEDPLIEVASNNTSTDAVDIGWYGKYAPSGTTLYAGLFRDTGDGKFKLFKSLQEAPTTTVNTSGTGYTRAGLVIGGLEATTGSFTDNIDIIGNNKYIRWVDTYGNWKIEVGDGANNFKIHSQSLGADYLTIDGSGNTTIAGNLTISGTGQSSFAGQVTIPATPIADTDAASKGYVDGLVEGQDTLAEILANGNTTGGTDIAVSTGDDITFADSSKSIYGTDNDFQIHHDGTNAVILNDTGRLIIRNRADNQDIEFDSDNGSGGTTTYFKLDGSATNVKVDKDFVFKDSVKANFGDGNDLQIYHDGSNSFVADTGTGGLFLEGSSEVRIRKQGTSEIMANFVADGSVNLYHNNSKKLETTSAGIQVTGEAKAGYLKIHSSIPSETSASTGYLDFASGNTRIVSKGVDGSTLGGFQILQQASDGSPASTAFSIDTSSNATFSGTIKQTGKTLTIEANDPEIVLKDTDEGTNDKVFRIINVSEELRFSARTDSNGANADGGDVLKITRSGNSTFAGNVILSSGYVDITDAFGKVEIESSTGTNQVQVKVENTGGSAFFGRENSAGSWFGTGEAYATTLRSDGAYPMIFRVNGGNRLTIDSSGNSTFAGDVKALRFDMNPDFAASSEYLIISKMQNQDGGIVMKSKPSGGSAQNDWQIVNHSTTGDLRFYAYGLGGFALTLDRENGNATFAGSLRLESTFPKIEFIDTDNNPDFTIIGGSGRLGFYDETNATERMRINSSGNVGIGTTSPSYLLHLEDSNGADLALSNSSSLSNGDYVGRIYGLDSSNNFFTGINMFYHDSNDGEIRFRIKTAGTNTDVMTLVDGNCGIGTTAPNRDLHVIGQLAIDNSTSPSAGLLIFGDSTSNKIYSRTANNSSSARHLDFISGSSTSMRIHDSGRVGIGTTSPSATLHLSDASNSSTTTFSANGRITMTGDGVLNWGSSAQYGQLTWDTNKAIVRGKSGTALHLGAAGNSNHMVIDTSGRVGIGTTSPSGNLHVNEENAISSVYITRDGNNLSTSTSIGKIEFASDYNSTPTTYGQILSYSNSLSGVRGSLDLKVKSTSGTLETGMTIFGTNAGPNVGIGTTSPQTYLHLGDYPSNNINISTYPDVPSEHMLHISAPETTNYYGGGISFGENSFTAANIVAIDAGGGGALHLAFGTGNSSGMNERMRITNSGNVGIGTTSPAYKLEVNGNVKIDSTLTIGDTGTSASYIYLLSSSTGESELRMGDTDTDAGSIAYNNNSDFMAFRANAAERMRIDSSGRVGIGETSIDAKLHLTASSSGLINQKFESAGSAAWRLGIPASQTYFAFDNTNDNLSTPKMVITTGGNVGIGTTSPSGEFHVFATGNADAYFQKSSGARGHIQAQTNKLIFGTTNNKQLDFKTNDGVRMTINTSGNVGINETSPDAKLHVNSGSTNVTSKFESTDATSLINIIDSASATYGVLLGATGNDFFIMTGHPTTTALNERMRVTSAGAVAIGVTSSAGSRMHVKAPSGTADMIVVQTGSNNNVNVGAIKFRDSQFSSCGQITVNGGTNTTSYVTSSDYRLKQDYQDFNGLDLVSNIPVYDFEWKKSGTRAYGVQAHELQEVLPQAVVGEKDGKEMQQVDYSKLTPVLLKAIQELKAEIETLKAQINN